MIISRSGEQNTQLFNGCQMAGLVSGRGEGILNNRLVTFCIVVFYQLTLELRRFELYVDF